MVMPLIQGPRTCIVCMKHEGQTTFPKRRRGWVCTRCSNLRHRTKIGEQAYKERRRKNWLRAEYGITPEEYDILYDEQGGQCGICGRDVKRVHLDTCVDHNHTTGKVRGILCRDCNTALGRFNDDVGLLLKATEYVLIGDAHEE